MKFARLVFAFAGITGLLMLLPQYFMESSLNRDFPPAITHPEYFYGFIGVAAAFQVVFLTIALDPVRYRLFMIAAVLEKLSFSLATVILFNAGRLAAAVLVFGMMDLALGVLFAAAFLKTSGVKHA
ncbi:MAG: hypothetical protein KIS76_17180 [Pyrinomonadaceae bacterium]|nr:hypothetical protein [Pyrinomonadaceae bacterium]